MRHEPKKKTLQKIRASTANASNYRRLKRKGDKRKKGSKASDIGPEMGQNSTDTGKEHGSGTNSDFIEKEADIPILYIRGRTRQRRRKKTGVASRERRKGTGNVTIPSRLARPQAL